VRKLSLRAPSVLVSRVKLNRRAVAAADRVGWSRPGQLHDAFDEHLWTPSVPAMDWKVSVPWMGRLALPPNALTAGPVPTRPTT
jgi:hypothetical protein